MDRRKQRELIGLIEEYVAQADVVPPLSLEELQEHALLMQLNPLDFGVSPEWLIIMLNNALWKDTVASIPAERKLFLLPQCLKNSTRCQAQTDELGLFCEQCGSCHIAGLTNDAEDVGMMSIVAEGSPVVRSMIEHNAADGIIGVSCLNSLKKAFPLMVNNAVPGVAIPLDKDGCVDTTVDVCLVRDYLKMTAPSEPKLLLDSCALEEEVKSYFAPAQLNAIMGEASTPPVITARDYLAAQGKRFRPFLCAAVYRCLNEGQSLSPAVEKLLIAVECFHKASLIHDDIEDDDAERDGEAALHTKAGIPIAINSGDLLLGEGYRLIAESLLLDDAIDKVALLQVASLGHLALCIGQGEELQLIAQQEAYSVEQIISIFKGKTAPAFEVALLFGALASKAEPALRQVLSQFSESFGIAYQIRDDIEDVNKSAACTPDRLSIILALEGEESEKPALTRAIALYDEYRSAAYRELRQIRNAELKRLLFRITTRILKDV